MKINFNKTPNSVFQPTKNLPKNPYLSTKNLLKYPSLRTVSENKVFDYQGVGSVVNNPAVCVRNITDYSPFGVSLDGRTIQTDLYRRGFNGMELDDEIKGAGNSYTTEFRQYDSRLGHWLSLDPLTAKFPWQSPYVAFDNNPICFNDPRGLEAKDGGEDKVIPVPNDTEVKATSNAAKEINDVIRSVIGKTNYNKLEENLGKQFVSTGFIENGILSNGEIIENGLKQDIHSDIDGTGILDDYDVFADVEIEGMIIIGENSSNNRKTSKTEFESSTEEESETGSLPEGIYSTTETKSQTKSNTKTIDDNTIYHTYDVKLKLKVSVYNEYSNKTVSKSIYIRATIQTQMKFTDEEMGKNN